MNYGLMESLRTPTPAADRPLEQWEQDWISEVQRRREQMGGTHEEAQT